MACDVTGVGELVERGKRRANPELRVSSTVHQLEQLHRELDVADAAGAELDLAFAESFARDFGLGARLHRAHRSQVFCREGARPQAFCRGGFEALAQLAISARAPGLEQR